MTLARRINCRDLNQVSKQPASWSVFVYVCNQIQPSRISDLCFGFRPIKGKHKTSLPELTGNVTNSLSNYHHSRRTLCISCQHITPKASLTFEQTLVRSFMYSLNAGLLIMLLAVIFVLYFWIILRRAKFILARRRAPKSRRVGRGGFNI